jgi:hypothetical protein
VKRQSRAKGGIGPAVADFIYHSLSSDPELLNAVKASWRRLEPLLRSWPEPSATEQPDRTDGRAAPGDLSGPAMRKVTVQIEVELKPEAEPHLVRYVKARYAGIQSAPGSDDEPHLSSLGEIVHEAIWCALCGGRFPPVDVPDLFGTVSTHVVRVE